jgi:hypothetical protein
MNAEDEHHLIVGRKVAGEIEKELATRFRLHGVAAVGQ